MQSSGPNVTPPNWWGAVFSFNWDRGDGALYVYEKFATPAEIPAKPCFDTIGPRSISRTCLVEVGRVQKVVCGPGSPSQLRDFVLVEVSSICAGP
jgi:hypothetical protein